jgi:protein-disulfide isomerase
MSDKGFLVLDKKVLEDIKSNSYLKWNKDAKVTWIEYSDLECPFCAKLHNSGTPEALEKKYSKDLNQVFQNFPLAFHKNALSWAEALECLGEEKWVDAYYELKHISFKNEKSDLSFLIDEAVKLWANKDKITKCIADKTFADKIDKQQKTGTERFGVTGTPWNVLINNETWEYSVISWAYPASSFEEIIDKLLK